MDDLLVSEARASEAVLAASVPPPTDDPDPATGDYLILDATNFTLPELLADNPPQDAIIGRANTMPLAGRAANAALRAGTRAGNANTPTRYVKQAIVRTIHPVVPGVFRGPGVVAHYDLQQRRKTAYAYRFLCGNYPNCENPTEPWMFYCPPGKNQNRIGPQVCGVCRRRHPSDATRSALAATNRSRAKKVAVRVDEGG